MALAPIPEAWRTDVCAILKSGDTNLIRSTEDFTRRFQADFLEAWTYEVYDACRHHLAQGEPRGCRIEMNRPAGETWEFFFTFKGRKTYGKILLRTDRKSVVLFSAHLPLKKKLSCE